MRRLTHDQGAVAVIVALLAVVLFGFGAFAVDISSLWSERQQLQNGADGAALAVAQLCAGGDCNSDTGYQATAAQYADDNANDNTANVGQGDPQQQDFVCGNGPGLPACLEPPYPPANAPGLGWVRVRTQTGDDSGSGLVPAILAKALVPGYDGSTVHTYAIANWGAPASISGGLALTFSACEWLDATGVASLSPDDLAAATYAAPPPYPNTTDVHTPPRYSATGWPIDSSGQSMERTIYLHGSAQAGTCDAGPAGSDLPGGFGWLDTTSKNTCYSTTSQDGSLPVDPGSDVSNACKIALDASLGANGGVIEIPVYGTTNDLNGNNGGYYVVGYAAFYMTGYSLGSVKEPSAVTGGYPCSKDDRCISGFFTEALDTAPGSSGVVGSGPSLGANIVGLYQ